jgi:RNA-directed DNA polymerase
MIVTMNDNITSDLNFQTFHHIDWFKVNKTVQGIRYRIFVNSQEKRFDKVRSLQKLMLSSKANYLYSIRKVTSNKGKDTAGVDNIKSISPEHKMQIFGALNLSTILNWNPPPVKRVYVRKNNFDRRKIRPVGIPTLIDRIIQTIVSNALEPEHEAQFEGYSFGFRPNRGISDALNAVFVPLSIGAKQWIVDCDIAGCYDNMSHPFVMSNLKGFPAYATIERWLKAGLLEEKVFVETNLGFPQGGPISPLLCNIALHGLMKKLNIYVRPKSAGLKAGHVRSDAGSNVIMVRYADDFIILCDTKEKAIWATEKVKEFLEERKLRPKKTDIYHSTQGFDFVGFNWKVVAKYGSKNQIEAIQVLSTDPYDARILDQKNTVVLANPSKKSITVIKSKLKEIFVDHRGKSSGSLIKRVNPIIRGWAESKIHGTSTRTFSELDHYLYNLQFKWAKRSHPLKNYYWRKKRYFTSFNFKEHGYVDNWVFRDPSTGKFMYKFRFFKVYDHMRLRNVACPDDPKFKEYWIELANKRFLKKPISPIIRKIDRELQLSQYMICPICMEGLDNGENVHKHHIIPRKYKGPDSFSNLLVLHETCHNSVHYANKDQKENFEKVLLEFKKQHPKIDDIQPIY